MPKKALGRAEWERRLHSHAQGSFVFTVGRKPPKDSLWARKIALVDRCPKHRNASSVDALGRRIECVCGYHAKKVQSHVSQTYIPIICVQDNCRNCTWEFLCACKPSLWPSLFTTCSYRVLLPLLCYNYVPPGYLDFFI